MAGENPSLAPETPQSDRESVKMPMDVSRPADPDGPTITSATFEMVLSIVPSTEPGDE